MFYESTQNMSADIYTKSFGSSSSWQHALKLINIFPKDWIARPDLIEDWLDKRRGLGNQIEYDDPIARTKWNKETKRT